MVEPPLIQQFAHVHHTTIINTMRSVNMLTEHAERHALGWMTRFALIPPHSRDAASLWFDATRFWRSETLSAVQALLEPHKIHQW